MVVMPALTLLAAAVVGCVAARGPASGAADLTPPPAPPTPATAITVMGDPNHAGVLGGGQEIWRLEPGGRPTWLVYAGHYEVYAQFPGRCVEVQSVDVAPGVGRLIDFPETTRVLTGRVLDRTGPLPSARVAAACPADGNPDALPILGEVEAETDLYGRFTLRGLSPGPHTLVVDWSLYEPLQLPVMTPDGAFDLGDVILSHPREPRQAAMMKRIAEAEARSALREGEAPDAGEVRPSWIMNDDRCDDLEKISCGNRFHGSAFILRGEAVVDSSIYSDDGGGAPFTNSAILDEFSACRSRFWRRLRP